MSMKTIHRALGEIVFSAAALGESTAPRVAGKLRDAADLIEHYNEMADARIEAFARKLDPETAADDLYKLTPEETAAVSRLADSVVRAVRAEAEPPPAPRKRGRKPRAAAANGAAAPESPAPSRPADDPPLPLEV